MIESKVVRLDSVLIGVKRCPQCGVASPEMQLLFMSDCIVPTNETSYGYNWGMYKCNTCKLVVLAQSELGNQQSKTLKSLYPEPVNLSSELPDRVRNYLAQAEESIHSPDGAAMLAGAAVDAMLKEKDLKTGSVYNRIDDAVENNILTAEMGEWAHQVRLGSNRPRHADDGSPHVTDDEAKQSVEFARMLGHILFVLPKRVNKGIQRSKSSE